MENLEVLKVFGEKSLRHEEVRETDLEDENEETLTKTEVEFKRMTIL
jgi:hypothetical protein